MSLKCPTRSPPWESYKHLSIPANQTSRGRERLWVMMEMQTIWFPVKSVVRETGVHSLSHTWTHMSSPNDAHGFSLNRVVKSKRESSPGIKTPTNPTGNAWVKHR